MVSSPFRILARTSKEARSHRMLKHNDYTFTAKRDMRYKPRNGRYAYIITGKPRRKAKRR